MQDQTDGYKKISAPSILNHTGIEKAVLAPTMHRAERGSKKTKPQGAYAAEMTRKCCTVLNQPVDSGEQSKAGSVRSDGLRGGRKEIADYKQKGGGRREN